MKFLTECGHQPGELYTDGCLAVGVFDHRGGRLRFSAEDVTEIFIPEGALTSMPQLVYLMLECDPIEKINITSFSPIIACGPTGLHFKVCVHIHVLL